MLAIKIQSKKHLHFNDFYIELRLLTCCASLDEAKLSEFMVDNKKQEAKSTINGCIVKSCEIKTSKYVPGACHSSNLAAILGSVIGSAVGAVLGLGCDADFLKNETSSIKTVKNKNNKTPSVISKNTVQKTVGNNSPTVVSGNSTNISYNTYISTPVTVKRKEKIKLPLSVDELLKKIPSGNIAFNTPNTMKLGKAHNIQLKLSLTESIEKLKSYFRDFGIKEENTIEGDTIKVSELMEANLSGAAFDIKAITPTEQAITSKGITSWQWEERGIQQLHLSLSMLFKVKDKDTKRSVRVFNKDIQVDSVWDRAPHEYSHIDMGGKECLAKICTNNNTRSTDESLETQLKSLEENTKSGNKDGMADSYTNLGFMYQTRGELTKAIEMQQKALEINESLGNIESMAINHANLGSVYEASGDKVKARSYYLRAIKQLESLYIVNPNIKVIQSWLDAL